MERVHAGGRTSSTIPTPRDIPTPRETPAPRELPTPRELKEIFSTVSPAYPLPPFGDERWVEQTEPKVWRDVEEYVDRALSEPPPTIRAREILAFGQEGDRSVYEKPYHERRTQLASLAAVICRDGDDEPDRRSLLVDELQDRLWAVCEETSWLLSAHQWNNGLSTQLPPPDMHAVDLGAAQTAFTLAEVLALTEPLLHPEIVDRVDYEIEQRVLRPYLHRNNFHWMGAYHNWNIVCHSGIVGAALYRSPNRYAPGIVSKALEFAPRFIEGHDEQGSSPEGIMVWNFGFGHLCMLNDMLERWTDGAVSLFSGREEKISAMAAFPTNVHLYENMYVNFSDAEETLELTPFIVEYTNRRLGLQQPIPPFRQLREHDYVLRHLFCRTAELFTVPEHERTVFFEGNQWMVARSDGSPEPAITIATKGGHNGESHNHNDLGSFVIHAAGENLISELGRDTFTRDSFAGDRYAMLPYSSRGHSVPRINGGLQSPGSVFRSTVLEQAFGPTDSVRYDLTHAYSPECRLSRFSRTFEFVRAEARLTVTDSFELTAGDRPATTGGEGDRPGRIEEVFWSFFPIERTGASGFRIRGLRAGLGAEFSEAPDELRIEEVPNAVFRRTAWVVVATFAVDTTFEVATRFTIDTAVQRRSGDEGGNDTAGSAIPEKEGGDERI